MAQLIVNTNDFSIESSWRCNYSTNTDSFYIGDGPTTGSHKVTFEWSDLGDVTIQEAKIHAKLSGYSPISGTAVKTVNGVSFDSDNFAVVSIDSNATSFVAEFKFKANGTVYDDYDLHTASYGFGDVYLLIEYAPNYTPPELSEYTDSDLVVGETYVKAVHMTELHSNLNLVRIARGLEAYSFTDIVALETSLGGWNNHVVEIRTALDDIGIEHEDWIELGENYPRLDVLLQLRRVVQAVADA